MVLYFYTNAGFLFKWIWVMVDMEGETWEKRCSKCNLMLFDAKGWGSEHQTYDDMMEA